MNSQALDDLALRLVRSSVLASIVPGSLLTMDSQRLDEAFPRSVLPAGAFLPSPINRLIAYVLVVVAGATAECVSTGSVVRRLRVGAKLSA